MKSKPPSSLDYDGHLHELALRNWHRALHERDVPRAELNARALTRSHDKLWRFVGNLHLALAHLGGGRASAALDALASAAHAYPEARRLVSIANVQSAHLYLETRSPKLALEILDDAPTTSDVRYWRALACSRLSRSDEARELADGISDDLLRAHVLVELGEPVEFLQRSVDVLPDEALASPRPIVPIAFSLATVLSAANADAAAHALWTRISDASEALFYWPLPYVRALYRSQQYGAFLDLWRDGEIDRGEVAKAIQLVNA